VIVAIGDGRPRLDEGEPARRCQILVPGSDEARQFLALVVGRVPAGRQEILGQKAEVRLPRPGGASAALRRAARGIDAGRSARRGAASRSPSVSKIIVI
jgi:hypothetical protein